MKAICIIPAKQISKRLPNKNIKKILGMPLIAHVIQNAIMSKCFKEVFVSTDSEKIKSISEKFGAKVSFLRSRKLSGNYTPVGEVIIDAIKKLKNNYNFEIVCFMYPTSIFADKHLIKKAIKLYKNEKVNFIFTGKKFAHPIDRGFILKKKNPFLLNKKNFTKRTQDFKESYYDAAQLYVGHCKDFLKKKNPYNSKSRIILMNYLDSIDIDNLEDFKNAEIILKLKKKNEKK
jgi:pseudaminic acid cytidylyltransferase